MRAQIYKQELNLMNFALKQKETFTSECLSLVAKLSQDEQLQYLDKIDISHMNAVNTLVLKDNIEVVEDCQFKNRVKRGIRGNIEWLRQQPRWIQTLIQHKLKKSLSGTISLVKYTIEISTSCFKSKVDYQKPGSFDDEQVKRINSIQQTSTQKFD